MCWKHHLSMNAPLEAALDRMLQAIVIDTPQDAVEAIEYLRSCSGGRVSFIARTAQKPPVDIPCWRRITSFGCKNQERI